MNLGLARKTVIVTGGGAGIGGVISTVLAEEYAIPAILGRSPVASDFAGRLHALQNDTLLLPDGPDRRCALRRGGAADCRSPQRHPRPR